MRAFSFKPRQFTAGFALSLSPLIESSRANRPRQSLNLA